VPSKKTGRSTGGKCSGAMPPNGGSEVKSASTSRKKRKLKREKSAGTRIKQAACLKITCCERTPGAGLSVIELERLREDKGSEKASATKVRKTHTHRKPGFWAEILLPMRLQWKDDAGKKLLHRARVAARQLKKEYRGF